MTSRYLDINQKFLNPACRLKHNSSVNSTHDENRTPKRSIEIFCCLFNLVRTKKVMLLCNKTFKLIPTYVNYHFVIEDRSHVIVKRHLYWLCISAVAKLRLRINLRLNVSYILGKGTWHEEWYHGKIPSSTEVYHWHKHAASPIIVKVFI